MPIFQHSCLAAALAALAPLGSVQAEDGDRSAIHFRVGVEEEAVVTGGTRILRVVKPGVRTKLPFVEQVWFIEKHLVRRQPFAVDGQLVDGSACVVSGDIFYRVEDVLKAFR